MARRINRLSPAGIRNAKSGMHADGGGLWLQVSEGQRGGLRRSWIFRYAVGERERKMGLGSLDTIGLAEAREKAGKCRQLRLQGIDPIDHRDAERRAQAVSTAKSITFKEAAERYIAAHRAGWRNIKHASQWANTLGTYAYPALGSLPVQAIDTGLVVKVLEPLWTKKPETAGRVTVTPWRTGQCQGAPYRCPASSFCPCEGGLCRRWLRTFQALRGGRRRPCSRGQARKQDPYRYREFAHVFGQPASSADTSREDGSEIHAHPYPARYLRHIGGLRGHADRSARQAFIADKPIFATIIYAGLAKATNRGGRRPHRSSLANETPSKRARIGLPS